MTPNAHALSQQFVTLDHFFASGGNSADGHQWLTQANETEYPMWPLYYGRSYPSEGIDALAYSSGGFLWEAAQSEGQDRSPCSASTRPRSQTRSDSVRRRDVRAVQRRIPNDFASHRDTAQGALQHALRDSVARPRAGARVSGLDAGSARRREGGRHPRASRRLGIGARDAESRDDHPAERSHGRNVGRLVHAAGLRRRQRLRARQNRRRA